MIEHIVVPRMYILYERSLAVKQRIEYEIEEEHVTYLSYRKICTDVWNPLFNAFPAFLPL